MKKIEAATVNWQRFVQVQWDIFKKQHAQHREVVVRRSVWMSVKIKPHLQCPLFAASLLMLEYIYGIRLHVNVPYPDLQAENVQKHKQIIKQGRQMSYRLFWNIEMWEADCAGVRLQHPPSWLRLFARTDESSDCWQRIEDLRAHLYHACSEQRIQTLEVDVNISSPAVIQAWKAPRNKMKWGELKKKDQAAATSWGVLHW